jgi:hypothetical protein
MNTLARTDQAYGLAVTRRSGIFRIFWVIVWTIAVGGGSTVSGAKSNSTPAERKTEQVVQPINFRQPAPLDFEDHVGYVRIFDGTSLKNWDGDPSFWHVENGARFTCSRTRLSGLSKVAERSWQTAKVRKSPIVRDFCIRSSAVRERMVKSTRLQLIPLVCGHA